MNTHTIWSLVKPGITVAVIVSWIVFLALGMHAAAEAMKDPCVLIIGYWFARGEMKQQ